MSFAILVRPVIRLSVLPVRFVMLANRAWVLAMRVRFVIPVSPMLLLVRFVRHVTSVKFVWKLRVDVIGAIHVIHVFYVNIVILR